MIALDTSAIAFNEPDAVSLEQRIVDDPDRLISAATILETSMVIEARFGDAGGSELDLCCTRSALRSSRPKQSLQTRRAAPGVAMTRAAIWQG